MSLLTEAELKLLKNYEERKKRHAETQAKYREQQIANNENYKEEYNKYMREYNQKRTEQVRELKEKISAAKPVIKTPKEYIKSVEEVPKVDRRTKRGKVELARATKEIQPSYLRREGAPLKDKVKEEYLRKADIIQRLFKNKSLTPELKAELKKLLNDNPNINEDKILKEMDYLSNSDLILSKLKEKYSNISSFKSYLNVIVVILSHIKSLQKIYQTLTKINKGINQEIQDERDENKLDEKDRDKIIKLDEETISKGLEKLKDIRERLIFGLYTLQPSIRLDYRNMIITNEKDKSKLDDENTNFIIISTNPKRFIFNDYKTAGAYKQKDISIKSDLLNNIIDSYISLKGLKVGDLFISQAREHRQILDQGNFSKLIIDTFYKALGIKTNLNFIRKSHIINFLKVPRSNKEKKELADTMAHSLLEQSKYYKIMSIE